MISTQMDIGKTISQWRQFTFSNSSSVNRTVGIWRFPDNGIIEPAYYDYDTEKIGPYEFHEVCGYARDNYYKYPTPDPYYLYREFYRSEAALVAIFVNNIATCTVYDDRCIYKIIETGEVTKVVPLPHNFWFPDLMNAGYVRTRPHCITVPVYPYRLKMDIKKHQVYVGNGIWKDFNVIPDPSVCETFTAYRQLVKTEYDIVYKDFMTKELVFL